MNSSKYATNYCLEQIHDRAISSIKISKSQRLVATASADKTVKILNLDDGACKGHLTNEHGFGVNDCEWFVDNSDSYLITCSDDRTIKIWDVETEKCLRTLHGHTGFVFSVKQHPINGIIISSSFDCTIQMWDVRSKCGVNSVKGSGSSSSIHSLATIAGHADPIVALDCNQGLHGSGREFVSGSLDGTVRIWDMASTHCLTTMNAENMPAISSLNYSANGKYLLVSTFDDTHRLWNVDTNVVAAEKNSLSGDASISEGSAHVSASRTENYVKNGHMPSSQPRSNDIYVNSNSNSSSNGIIREYIGHLNRKYNIFSRLLNSSTYTATGGLNGRAFHIVSGSEDGSVCLWDVNGTNNQPAEVLTGHKAPVIALDCIHRRFEPNAKVASVDIIVSGDLNGTVMMWSKGCVHPPTVQ